MPDKKPSFFKKRICYFLEVEAGNNSGAIIEAFRQEGIQPVYISWERFNKMMDQQVVVVLNNPPLDKPELEVYISKFHKNENAEMRLIILSDNENWKLQNINYYMHIVPNSVSLDEIKRQYFQLSSYLSNKTGFFKNFFISK